MRLRIGRSVFRKEIFQSMLNEFPIFDYEDIQLIPNKCIINSRSEADTTVQFGKHTFKLPVVPANMQTILDEDVAEQLARGGYFYIMHRFDEAGRIPFVKRMHDQGLIASISVGVKEYEYDFVSQLKEDVPEYITIDIAHGHADSVIRMIQHIKKELPDTFVIAGNVGTPEAVRELENAGADATPRSGLVLVRFVSPKLRLDLVQVVGNWLLFAGAQKQRVSQLLRTVGFGPMVILPNRFVSGRLWS